MFLLPEAESLRPDTLDIFIIFFFFVAAAITVRALSNIFWVCVINSKPVVKLQVNETSSFPADVCRA